MEDYFFFNDTATTEIYTLSLHDALPISAVRVHLDRKPCLMGTLRLLIPTVRVAHLRAPGQDRKSTRLNSSHANISYAVFCLKKKNVTNHCNPLCTYSTPKLRSAIPAPSL